MSCPAWSCSITSRPAERWSWPSSRPCRSGSGRLGAHLLSQLLDRGIDPRLAQSLITDAGLDLAASVLAVARAETDQDCAELHRKLARSHLPHLLLDRDHLLHVVLPDDGVGRAPGVRARRIGTHRQQRPAGHGGPPARSRAGGPVGARRGRGGEPDAGPVRRPDRPPAAQERDRGPGPGLADPRPADHPRRRARHRLRRTRSGSYCGTTGHGSWPRPNCTSTSRRWATASGRSSSSPAAA